MSNIQEAFDKAASDYDRWRRQILPCFDEYYSTAVSIIPFDRDELIRVLDLGAGTGLLSEFASRRFPNADLTLVDISEEMLTQARARFDGRKPEVKILKLNYADEVLPGNYDVVMSALSIHHLPDESKTKLFHRIYDSLKQGGIFINADHIRPPTPELEQQYRKIWIDRTRELGISETALADALERAHMDQLATLEEQLEWLKECGFSEVNCAYKWLHFAVYNGRRL